MNLYVWENFKPDYADGLAFAIADSEEEAREMLLDTIARNNGYTDRNDKWFKKLDNTANFGPVEIFPVTSKIVRYVNGGS